MRAVRLMLSDGKRIRFTTIFELIKWSAGLDEKAIFREAHEPIKLSCLRQLNVRYVRISVYAESIE